jgi:hypothetical protein
MNFSRPYQIIGNADSDLVEKLNTEINKISDDYYNYTDVDSVTKQTSWVRLDFDYKKVQHPRETAIWQSGVTLINDLIEKYQIDNVSSFSISMLKPNQTLEEHTDSRLVHRLTNRYIVPLIDAGDSYNYWYVGPEKKKVIHYLKKGELFRVNNAIIHAAVNTGNIARYNLLIDTFPSRLIKKFGSSIDLAAPLSREGYNFSTKRQSNNTNDQRLNGLAQSMMDQKNAQNRF